VPLGDYYLVVDNRQAGRDSRRCLAVCSSLRAVYGSARALAATPAGVVLLALAYWRMAVWGRAHPSGADELRSRGG